VHRYDIGLQTTLRLHTLIDEYGRMRRLEGMTPQQRGQRFNEFIADVLRCWGLDRVEADVRSVGEIDVTFAIDGTRFILEAKWGQDPLDFGPIAKLRGRMTQRLTGTCGVFLSMSGYSPEALEDMLKGRQPDMLLLDQTHLEGILSGLFSPSDLFTELLDRASYRGQLRVAITDLLVPKKAPPLPRLVFGNSEGDSGPAITEAAPGVHAEVVLHGTEPQKHIIDGIIVDTCRRLLLTMPTGVVRADLESGALGWAVPISQCRGDALDLPDGSILVTCGETILRWDGSELHIIAGGFTGKTCLLRGPRGEPWVFDYASSLHRPFETFVTLTRLGEGLGEEERHPISFGDYIVSAVWLSQHRFFLAGLDRFGVVDLDVTTAVPLGGCLSSPHPAERGAIRTDEHTVMTATRQGTVHRIDVETGESTFMARLDRSPLSGDMAADNQGRAFVLQHRFGPRTFSPVVVALSGYST
jgi:hypothetical protein